MAHGFLSYQDTRGEVDYLGKIYRAIKDYLDKREKREQQKDAIDEKIQEVRVQEEQAALPGAETPLLKQGTTPKLPEGKPPLQRMLGGSALQRAALPGAMVTPTQAMGGPLANVGFSGRPLKPEGFVGDKIVDISATTVGVERDLGGGDMFVKRLNTIDDGLTGSGGPGGSGEVVQAIDRLTFVTMSLVAATKEQTQQQMLIAARQEQSAEKMARDAKALAEENALEMGSDLSGNLSYEKLANIAGGAGSGGGGRGLAGFGAKAAATNLGKAAMKRGGTRAATRLGAGLGMKVAGKSGAKIGAKIGAKTLGGVVGKKLPFGLGLAVAGGFAADRFGKGDVVGGVGEILSGLAAIVPGVGTAASLGIDGLLAARDFGLTPFADGGIISKPTAGLVGEAGKEGIFPLEGAKGKKTFRMFGEGILEAQRRNKSENAKRLAEGLGEYYDKQNGWEKFMEALGNFIKDSPLASFFKWGNGKNPNGDGGGGGNPGSRVGNDLFSLISGGEGGINSYNTGTAGSQAGYTPPKPISQMTVGQIMDAQSSGSLFAVGKYQIIPDTMKGFVKNMKISRDDIFNEETQDKFKEYTINLKRPKVGRFLKGDSKVSLEQAQIELAAEFASVGVPRDMKKGEYGGGYPRRDIKKGESLYSGVGGNAASITPEEIATALQKEKELNSAPPPPPKKEPDRRNSDASQRILRNYGKKDGESIQFMHNGQNFHAVKTTNGWDIYRGRGGIEGNKGRVDTSKDANGKIKNEGVLNSFLEQAEAGGGYRIEGAENSLEADLERVKSASADVSTKMSAKSTENAIASSTGAGTTIINNITNVQGSGGNMGGNAPADIAFGISSSSMGNNWANELALRTA